MYTYKANYASLSEMKYSVIFAFYVGISVVGLYMHIRSIALCNQRLLTYISSSHCWILVGIAMYLTDFMPLM